MSQLGQLNESYKIINGRTCQNNLPAVLRSPKAKIYVLLNRSKMES